MTLEQHGVKGTDPHAIKNPSITFDSSKTLLIAVARVAQWVEGRSVNRKVAHLISSEGTCPDCRLGPHLGACKRQLIDVSHSDVSLLFLPPSPSL